MKERIIKEVERLCNLAGVPVISSSFSLRGKVAGRFKAQGEDCGLHFNLIFATNHPEEYIARTVIHEVAHYVRYARNGYYGDRQPNGKRDSHGAKWRAVMQELGAKDTTRCHSYDTSVIPQTKRVYKKFEYSCDEGHKYELTAIRHNRSQKGTKYLCRECDSTLHFRGQIS